MTLIFHLLHTTWLHLRPRYLYGVVGGLAVAGIICFGSPAVSQAQERSNNKYGIHLAQPDPADLERAAALVNSNGGDWGYVTLVMQEDDLDRGKWQSIFEKMRTLRLIPIIRLATHPQGASWRRPEKEDAASWVVFLNSLNWVVKERHVILFNEPNHGAEWGGAVNPQHFKEVSLEFARALKSSSDDYRIMLAGFDASAPAQPPRYHDEEVFIRAVFSPDTVAEWNTLLSAWSSHSYPNPAFAGSPQDTGRGTIRTYEWELSLLRSLGVSDLPVFITETGWDAHRVGQEQAAAYMRHAYMQVWHPDSRVVAVTPFLLSYLTPPFSGFSWIDAGVDLHPVYHTIQSLPKTAGDPEVIDRGVMWGDLPDEIVVGSLYRFPIVLRNTGQAIWDAERGYRVKVDNLPAEYYYASDLKAIGPYEERQIYIYAQTLKESIGLRQATIALYHHDRKIRDLRGWNFEIDPLPELALTVRVFPTTLTDSNEYELQIFDENEQVVFKKKPIQVTSGKATVQNVPNIVMGAPYRLVILRPYYLPRQTFVRFQKGRNEAVFPWMIPVDVNGDGAFDRKDILILIQMRGGARS